MDESSPQDSFNHLARSTGRGEDRRALALLFCTFTALYGYFYQGGGWNQNSQFDTVRAMVELGTTEITPYADNTGDVGTQDGRVYSNKPPGLALLGAPVYFAAYHLEEAVGRDPASPKLVTVNANLLTFLTSGLPGVVVVLLLYVHFRRRGATVREGWWLAAAFGAGTLALPFSGALMSHLLTACLLFGGWMLVTAVPFSARAALLAGLLSGAAVLTDSLALPAAALFFLYAAATRTKQAPWLVLGAAPMVLLLLAHNYLSFGSPLVGNTSLHTALFKRQGLLMGELEWPRIQRVWWLTFHPNRGLFLCCPLLLVSFWSMRWPRPVRSVAPETVVAIGIVVYHFLFNVCFIWWDGGWGVGPRYLIPALPFLFSFALTGFRRLPLVSGLLAGLSAVLMFAVAAVQLMLPGPEPEGPSFRSPVLYCLWRLATGGVSLSKQGMLDFFPVVDQDRRWASYNLGELAGLHGWASLVPILAILLAAALLARRLGGAPAPDTGAAAE